MLFFLAIRHFSEQLLLILSKMLDEFVIKLELDIQFMSKHLLRVLQIVSQIILDRSQQHLILWHLLGKYTLLLQVLLQLLVSLPMQVLLVLQKLGQCIFVKTILQIILSKHSVWLMQKETSSIVL